MNADQCRRCAHREILKASALLAALVLAGCGGGSSGGASSTTSGTGTTTSTYVAGQYLAASKYAAQCADPRTGVDPVTNVTYPDVQGTAIDENNYLRSWTHQLYLWFSDVPDLDPSLYTTVDYFPLLKTSAVTASGAAVDRFHFTYPTATWEALSEQGVAAGYGVNFDVIASTPPRNITVAFVDPNATGAATTLARGAAVQSIDTSARAIWALTFSSYCQASSCFTSMLQDSKTACRSGRLPVSCSFGSPAFIQFTFSRWR